MHSMYTLYRAWLMRDALSLSSGGACGTLPPMIPATTPQPTPATTGAPNVVIQVGPTLTHFSAHRNVLANHSGYFKAALANETSSTPISIPNINVDEFSSLLTFMYTGYLDLNLGNIYNILLATHVLHMPRALELCRDFLIRNQPLEAHPSPGIIKPIPSRKYLAPPQQYFQPVATNLPSSDITSFKPIASETQPQPSTSRQTPSPILDPCEPDEESGSKDRKHRTKRTAPDDKVIVDIACCDGPVRFQRVVNNCYGVAATDTEYKMVDSNAAMNKAMNANIRDKKLQQPDENASQESFTCVYCNHTFKSQYCYQKHARRHINPVTLEIKNCTNESISTISKREVKLLDMNVQYYPCKTCGSKFPSYYFVHKHRKMCHADEVERSDKNSGDEKSN